MTKILRINPINPQAEMIREAAAVIKNGGTVAFPTETVYGIGADAFNAEACSNIFRIKGRPIDNPLIVHISKQEQLSKVAVNVPQNLIEAAKILWPGPVTFILKKAKDIPNEVSAGLDTVAVRMPAHPIALRLIDQSETPIAAPSANISKKPSATKAEHVIKDLDGKVDLIIDGGEAAFGLESTIIDTSVKPYVLLRPGAFTVEELEKYLGKIKIPESINKEIGASEKAIAPGMKYRHYAPEKKLIVVKTNDILMKAADFIPKNKKFVVLCSNEMADRLNDGANIKIMRLGSESNLYEISKNIFDSFRRIDKLEADFALVQTFPERGIGLALMNRIIKASAIEPVDSIEKLKKLF